MASLDQTLMALANLGVAGVRELASRLRVSQPTVLRLLAAARGRVYRMGRARRTRYALTRSLPGLGTSLPIHVVDEMGNVHRHGMLHLLDGGRHWLERVNEPGQLFEGLPPFG